MNDARQTFEAIARANGGTDFSLKQDGRYAVQNIQSRWTYFRLGWEAQQKLVDRFKDFPVNDWGEPIIYDTNEIDEITGFLTGDEGEEDSVTVLHNLVRYLDVVHPGKTMTQVLIETEEAALKAQPPQFPTMLRKMWSGKEVQEWINENWNKGDA